MTINERVRYELQLRKRQEKLRQKDVAAAIGLTPRKLSLALNGNRRLTVVELLGICMVAGIDPAIFMQCDELDGVRARMAYLKPTMKGGDEDA